jgi:hypothetical protein
MIFDRSCDDVFEFEVFEFEADGEVVGGRRGEESKVCFVFVVGKAPMLTWREREFERNIIVAAARRTLGWGRGGDLLFFLRRLGRKENGGEGFVLWTTQGSDVRRVLF